MPLVLTAGLSVALAAGPSPAPAATKRVLVERVLVERRLLAMGTSLEVSVVAPSREAGLDASERAVEEVLRIEDLLTTWRESPLDRLNRATSGDAVPVGPEIAGLLAEVFRWAQRTDRAFDPTVAPLMRAWDLRGAGRVPGPEELAAAAAATGPWHFRLDAARGLASRLDPRAGIDEGAWGKGYALDRAAQRLDQSRALGALVDLGGQALGFGRDPAGSDWTIGIAHPRDRQRAVVAVALTNASASTSANSERGRTVGARRIGHELDPHTGEPADDFGSVTVVAPSGLVADVLSTAFFVLGPEKGLALSDALRNEGVAQEVLFLIDRGEHLEAAASPDFGRRVLWADPLVLGLPARPAPGSRR